MFNIASMMKEAQKLQKRIEEVQAEIAEIEVVGEAGAGLVKVTLTGKNEARRVEINESLLTEDKEILEDLICAAINDATRRAAEASQAKMASVTEGMPLPPGMKLPF